MPFWFHPLPIRRVERETTDAASSVLDVPAELRDAFSYEAGQFLTFRVWVDDQPHLRCHSMSSSPAVDSELQVTVKRVPGGVVSNWMNETLAPGHVVEATRPAGVFCLGPGDGDVVAFSAGSGITPVFSLLKAALSTTSRRVRLLYANRDRDAVIFGAELDVLVERYRGRLEVVHHLDVERGFVDADALGPFVEATPGAEFYVCGPTPFMDLVEGALSAHGVDAAHIHIERFTPASPPGPPATSDGAEGPAASETGSTTARVTVELDGRTDTVDHHPGTTILQTARQMGMTPPFSCESGSCATCMAKLVEGAAEMHVNNALTDDEVADGWVLTCQAVPARRRCTSSTGTGRPDHGAIAHGRHHRHRAGARPVRRRHDQGRHRGRHRRVHPRRHLQRLRVDLRARRLPDTGERRTQGPVPHRHPGARAGRRHGHRRAAAVLRRPDEPRDSHRLVHRHLPPHRARLAAAHAVDDVPAPQRRPRRRQAARPDPTRADAQGEPDEEPMA